MEIILLERIRKLGQMGDTVVVKDGYARNYLLPQNKALRSTKANREYFDSRRVEIETRNLEAKKEAETVATKLEGASAVLIRQAGESGNLYGSVSARDISDALSAQDLKVDRTQVVLDHAIKTLGIYTIKLKLHAEVYADVKINVARSREEAEMQERGLEAKQAEEDQEVSVEDYFEKEEDLEAVISAEGEDVELAAEEEAPEAEATEDEKAEDEKAEDEKA